MFNYESLLFFLQFLLGASREERTTWRIWTTRTKGCLVGVGKGMWRLGSSYSLHAVWLGVPRALMLLPPLPLLLGQLRRDDP